MLCAAEGSAFSAEEGPPVSLSKPTTIMLLFMLSSSGEKTSWWPILDNGVNEMDSSSANGLGLVGQPSTGASSMAPMFGALEGLQALNGLTKSDVAAGDVVAE